MTIPDFASVRMICKNENFVGYFLSEKHAPNIRLWEITLTSASQRHDNWTKMIKTWVENVRPMTRTRILRRGCMVVA